MQNFVIINSCNNVIRNIKLRICVQGGSKGDAHESTSVFVTHLIFLSSDDALCEDLSEVNETMFDIALEALKEIRQQGKHDPETFQFSNYLN